MAAYSSVFKRVEKKYRIGAAAALPVFVGIKKKFKGIVYKRRLALTLPAALAFVSGLPYEQACARWPLSDAALAAAALSPVTRQIARELEVAMDRWLPLVPSMGIACDRAAWAYRPEMFQEREGDGGADKKLDTPVSGLVEWSRLLGQLFKNL